MLLNEKIHADTNVTNIDTEGRTISAVSLPVALPLRRMDNKSIRRYEDWDDKGKDSKISKIFQLTVTALSFLAFGGYLLTLIITAIRRTQNTTTPASLIVFSVKQFLHFLLHIIYFTKIIII
jgi:uncharacterized protein YqhQ